MEDTMLRSSRGAGTWQNSGSHARIAAMPVHDKGIGARPALLLRRRPTLASGVAERRRPGQRQNIEIELSGPVLAIILGSSQRDRGDYSNGAQH